MYDVQLLDALGYQKAQGVYRHPERKVIFLVVAADVRRPASWSRLEFGRRYALRMKKMLRTCDIA